MAASSSQLTQAEVAPDPDSDDLDDLDDVLEQFSSNANTVEEPSGKATHTLTASDRDQASVAAKAVSPTEDTDGTQAPQSVPDDDTSDPEIDDAFVQNLEQGMAELLASTDAPPGLKAQLEGFFHALEDPEPGDRAQPMPSEGRETKNGTPMKDGQNREKEEAETEPEPEPEPGSKTFQDKIQQTMNRMQDSSAAATSATDDQSKDPSSDPEALLAQLFQQMEAAGLGSDGKANAENPASSTSDPGADSSADPLNSMLLNIMSQLTHKEILYEPMKELHDKFPKWIARHETADDDGEKDGKGDGGKAGAGAGAGAVSGEDMRRYKEQQRIVAEIVNRFELPGYSDHSVEDREFIVERMQVMQAAGSPPPDLVGDIGATQEALADMESGCPQQ